MVGINTIYKADNLDRAWRWIRSNADASYKSYFRDLYSIYAISDNELLADLQDRLRRDLYEPSHACKIYFPKPSGILRPYSLLTVEDQIVYQAAVNIVAERLFPKVRRRYNKEVFGHLYAGKPSKWFYRKWSDGYAKFNTAARAAFADGHVYSASFDLTACYDSLDHGVLAHFLGKIGFDNDFCQFLTRSLSQWTATDHRIYHNHGIPQGPLSSGLLAEVVLRHFDQRRGRQASVRYFRYVDDIKLFAKNEKNLREMLVRLDELSKDIGLFPQSAKISIHKVKDIDEELKTISNPSESSVRSKVVNQEKLRSRITELSPKYLVSDPTRFKYLLAHAAPNSVLTSRLLRIYEKSPEYYKVIAYYLAKYDTIPRKASEWLIEEIRTQRLYSAIPAKFVETLKGRVHPSRRIRAKNIIAGRWKPRSLQPELFASIAKWQLHYDRFSYNQIETAVNPDKAWWARANVTFELHDRLIGKPSLETLVNKLLRDESDDVALAAASIVNSHSLSVHKPVREINRSAARVLKALGSIRRASGHVCGVQSSLKRMANSKAIVNWRTLFGSDYRQAEQQIIVCRAFADTNITAWVNAYDVFNDLLLMALYRHDPALGIYTAGGIGSVMNSSRLAAHFPAVQALIKSVHEKRYESNLSHAKQRRTGKATGQVRYAYLRKVKPMIRAAATELAAKW